MTRRVDLVPGRLRALVSAHTLSAEGVSVPCTTWRTDGFAAHGQPELTLTLRRDDAGDAEALSLDAMRFVTGVFERVAQGAPLHPGLFGDFPAGLFDAAEPFGAVLVRPEAPLTPALPPRGLRVLVLHRDERALAQQYGHRRVLARLARRARQCPFPPWWDAARPSVATPDEERSVLRRALRAHLVGATASMADDRVTLTIAPASLPGLRDLLARAPERLPLALLVDAPRDADAWLVWEPGQQGVSAATRAGSEGRCVAGNFVLITDGAQRDAGALCEDGFAFALTDPTARALRDALDAGLPYEIHTDGRGLALRFAEPEGLPTPPQGFRQLRMEVLSGMGHALAPRALSDWLAAVREAAEAFLGDTWWSPGQDVLVHLELRPGSGPQATLGVRPGPAPEALDGLCRAVESVPAPEPRGAVAVRMEFALWGGARGYSAGL